MYDDLPPLMALAGGILLSMWLIMCGIIVIVRNLKTSNKARKHPS